jgi:hypothetical protein
MPYVIDRPKKRAPLLVLAVCVALLGFARPAFATTSSCSTTGNAAAVFAPFGDLSLYVPTPGGSFESNTTQKWSLTKEQIVTGNEPWYVNSAKDTQSLSLTSGGVAVSPPVCVSAQRPWWRFFATSHNGSTASTLSVWAQWTDSYGVVQTTPVTTLLASNNQSWTLTPQLVFGSAIGTGTATNATLHFTTTGKWQIDDVYVDPYAR